MTKKCSPIENTAKQFLPKRLFKLCFNLIQCYSNLVLNSMQVELINNFQYVKTCLGEDI